jgi:hypothetical protein
MQRRDFLKSFLVAGAVTVAPAICKSEWLMPVKSLVLPETFISLGDALNIGQIYTFSTYIKSESGGSWNRVSETFKYDGTNGKMKFGYGRKELWGTQLEWVGDIKNDGFVKHSSKTPVGRDMDWANTNLIEGSITTRNNRKAFDPSIYNETTLGTLGSLGKSWSYQR